MTCSVGFFYFLTELVINFIRDFVPHRLEELLELQVFSLSQYIIFHKSTEEFKEIFTNASGEFDPLHHIFNKSQKVEPLDITQLPF